MDSPIPSSPLPPYTRSSSSVAARTKPDSRLTPPPLPSTIDDCDYDHHRAETQLIPFGLSATATTPLSRKKPEAEAASPSPLQLSAAANRSSSPVSLRELLLSPSPRRKPRARSLIAANAAVDSGCQEGPADAGTPKKKGKTGRSAASVAGIMGCAGSPRNVRRARRRLEKEIVAREEKGEMGGPAEEHPGRARKRKQSRAKEAPIEDKQSSAPFVAAYVPSPGAEVAIDHGCCSLDGLWEQISELIMWKNVAKSTLWFGFGSMFLLSSYFSNGISFSIISMLCQLGLLILGLNFFRHSVPQRQQIRCQGNFQMTEDDIVRAARILLPFLNAILANIQEIFSGDPSRTLKVAPIMLFGAMYGQLITLWRLFATGFFVSFTIPKLYSCYSQQIQRKVDNAISWIQEAWRLCPRKRLIAASAATLFWNLFSVKTRMFAAFISVVLFRYHNQQVREEKDEKIDED